MKVLKFGGTSVGSADSIKLVLEIIQEASEKGEKPVVVLSALSGVTNLLTRMCDNATENKDFLEDLKALEQRHFDVVRALLPVNKHNPVITRLKLFFNELEELLQAISSLGELSPASKDWVLSFGERCSTYMISKISEVYLPSPMYIDARNVIKTDSHFQHAYIDHDKTNTLVSSLAQSYPDKTLFITGFIGSNEKGQTTTLGRGGSDYTAALFATILGAKQLEIWTDVDGLLTADPRAVKKAFTQPVLSYTEAMELSYFGAKVIYPPSLMPVFKKQIPVVIRNTFNKDLAGTKIQQSSGESKGPIKGISSISKVSLVNLSGSGMIGKTGFSGRLFSLLAREQINVILITQSSSEHSITFAISPEDSSRAIELINQEFELELLTGKLHVPEVEDELSVLAIVGENMKQTPGISGRLFYALGRNGVNVRAIAQGSSEYNISVILAYEDLSKALNAVHDAFFEQLKKTLNVFILGTGNIGGTLINQLHQQSEFLREQNDLDIRIVGLSNSRKMLFNEEGVNLDDWSNELNKEGEVANLAVFIEHMQNLNLPNCVFIDNTASTLPTTYYLEVFESNISIVTCNKIANSGDYAQYQALKETAKKHGVDFYYETNVGAGLPIIRVLKDLMLSGDRITKIEAILSGTISYIFNHFVGASNFGEVVKQAQELGFTEPDPRDDLSGTDFMRKMLILARDAGFPLETEDVKLEAILPKVCMEAESVDAFYQSLQEQNDYFENLKKEAASQQKLLRYIGTLEEGKVSISMEMVDITHPFYSLSGSDNIISFTTERYKNTPLVVKGPGAGAEVTAAGVFADLVNVGNK
ncbi:MAG TPA: bifunctional aspartate kinase/homoserine dehydrogenase I [Candidatus Sphingobacterium stercoripullorum]|nr:bifunctional aspartate kinase/homoserine dehydrogenase I [Candidatus Sphingobacterium stercoripullorum]